MNDRRTDDPRIVALVDDMRAVKAELAANTAITQQVADVLASFRVLAAIAKWIAAIIAAVVALRHVPDWFSHRP